MFELDLGSDGSSGPYIAWSARGTQDGIIDPMSFYIRDGGHKEPIDVSKGMVLDIETLKTGWQRSEGMAGVAPEWKWNPNVNQMMQKPGDDYKKGFSVKCAIGGGKVAMWEQAGAGVWSALADLAPMLTEQPAAGQMPLIKMKEAKELKFTKGSTCYPIFEIVKWVDKPDCLKEGAAAGIATDPAPAPEPAPAAVEDDMEF